MASLGEYGLTAAVTQQGPDEVTGLGKVDAVSLIVALTATGGGTTCKVYVQTSLDDGVTWYDVACAAFTNATAVKAFCIDGRAQVANATPLSGGLADNTAQHGLLGDRLRYRVTSTGTFGAGSKVSVSYATR